MNFCILHLSSQGPHCRLDRFPRAELNLSFQLRLILFLQLELAKAHWLHVIDINGSSCPHNGFVAQSIQSGLVRFPHLLQPWTVISYPNGHSHFQNPPNFLAYVSQKINKTSLCIVFVNGC